ncbi:hypothetical protein KKB18_08080, partial [bacterium]|nr:hypothetical protein [bacterium]
TLNKLSSIQNALSTGFTNISVSIISSSILDDYDKILKEFFGNSSKLSYDYGRWLELVKGKPILNSVINNCMKNTINGKRYKTDQLSFNAIKSIIINNAGSQPTDFQELYQLIQSRIKS